MKTNIENAMITVSPPRKPFLPGGREILISSLIDNWSLIIKDGRSVLLSSRQVMDALLKLQLLPSLSGKQLAGANAMGDVLGARHFNLPFVVAGTKRKYLIPAIAWTAEAKQEFETLPVAGKLERLKALETEFLGEGVNGGPVAEDPDEETSSTEATLLASEGSAEKSQDE